MTLQAKCAFLLPRVHLLVIVIQFDAGLIFFPFPGRFHFPRIHNENSNESLHGRRRISSPISTCQVVTGTVPLQVNMCQRLFDYSSRLIPPPHTPTPWLILVPGLTFATSGFCERVVNYSAITRGEWEHQGLFLAWMADRLVTESNY